MVGGYVAVGFAANPLDEGRCNALQARLAWKLGQLDEALHRYQGLERAARRHKLPELRVRAWIGFAIVARQRGNYPDSRRWAARAAAAADHLGLRALAGVAVHAQLVGAAVAGDFDSALVFGWRGFREALGDPVREAEMLVTLAQLLLDIGHPRLALRGFAAAIDRGPVPRFLYPALGGAAIAAARQHLHELVSQYARSLEDLGHPTALPYLYASAQLDVARAFSILGSHREAERWSARALTTATELGFHEIGHYARDRTEHVGGARAARRRGESSRASGHESGCHRGARRGGFARALGRRCQWLAVRSIAYGISETERVDAVGRWRARGAN
jgi:tetratricopeptide (TPR) repeat protein